MGLIQNPLKRKSRDDELLSQDSNAETIDLSKGAYDFSGVYYPNKEDAVMPILQALLEKDPELYQIYIKRYSEALQKVDRCKREEILYNKNTPENHGLSAILGAYGELNQVVYKITSIPVIARRAVDNFNIISLVDSYRAFFDGSVDISGVTDEFMEKQGDIFFEYLRSEEMTRWDEDVVISKLPEWNATIMKEREAFASKVDEFGYRDAMLQILNIMLNHPLAVIENPFENYPGNEQLYLDLFMGDMDTFSKRVEAFTNSASEEVKNLPFYNSMMDLKKEIEYRLEYHKAKGINAASETFRYENATPADSFFFLAKTYISAVTLISELEHQKILDENDRKVREEAEKTQELMGGVPIREKSVDELISRQENLVDMFDVQFSIARKKGLITRENYLPYMNVKSYSAREVLSLMERAEAQDEHIFVFPDFSTHRYDVLIPHRLRDASGFDEVFTRKDVYGKNRMTHYIGKLPQQYVYMFCMAMSSIDKTLHESVSYTLDSSGGTYSFYCDENGTSPKYNATKSDILEAYKKSVYNMTLAEGAKNPSRMMCPYFTISPSYNMVQPLEELNHASIQYFVDGFDEKTGVARVYFDPASLEKVTTVLRKYKYINVQKQIVDPKTRKVHDNEVYPECIQTQFVKDVNADNEEGIDVEWRDI